MTLELTDDEAEAVVDALTMWLAIYAQGVRPSRYTATERAARKMKGDAK